jgi:hypothetical protein
VALLLLLLLGSVLLFGTNPKKNDTSTSLGPARVIIGKAAIVDQGVQLNWLAGQPGTYPLDGYSVQRSRAGSSYQQIAFVDKQILTFLDADGRRGDKYRVLSRDVESKARYSKPSDTVVAAPVEPGAVSYTDTPHTGVLGASTAAEAGTPTEKVIALLALSSQTTNAFDKAVDNKDMATAGGLLRDIQVLDRQMLALLPQVPKAQQMAAAQGCEAQTTIVQTNLYVLPESVQMDGVMAMAGCNAIKDLVQ